MRRAWLTSFVGSAVLSAMPAAAQVPAGPEFQVNTYTTFRQSSPTVSAAPDGGFLITWVSLEQDGDFAGVLARRYDSMGQPRGPEFQVNSSTTNSQFDSAAAFERGGRALVVWSSDHRAAALPATFAQLYGRDGARLGAEFAVNTNATAIDRRPSVAARRDRSFVVAFDRSGVGDVFARVFDLSGAATAPEFQVTATTIGGFAPAVAATTDGGFVVTWTVLPVGPPDFRDVYAQRYSSSGAPAGAEFRVNTYTTGRQEEAAIVPAPGGGFTVFWTGERDIWGQRYAADGVPAGGEFFVNTYFFGYQRSVAAAADELGNMVVTWSDLGRDGSGWGVYGQRLDPSGVRRGADFQVNSYTTGYQQYAQVGMDEVGNFVVAWDTRQPQDPTQSESMARRFGGLRPVSVVVDPVVTKTADGNQVLDPGEQAWFRPTWRNVSDVPITFTGSIPQFTGPAGPTYQVLDPNSNYGTVNSGGTSSGDLYSIGVSAPAGRPAQHWDAFLTEAISPDAQGQRKRWAVHVGESFTDVPRFSGFYRFVEALFHHGVTAGCGPSLYCPGNSTTREQMSAFVLVAKEGVGYLPPACTTPVFDDVPASSPFCRWIEELARRGVTGGCAGGNYCPTAAVAREEMAVFVLRTLDPTLTPPACTTPVFNDVPASSPFCPWIEELARRGIVTGCAPDLYCPTAAVTREQMAVFLTGTFGLTLYGP